jgi:DNA-binding ferritin-like protein (Dps family)
MAGFINKIIGDKKEWKEMEARAKALPDDYQIVYGEIKQYVWKSSGLGAIDVLKGLLDLFEEGACNGNGVLEITGDNVAAFSDELMRGAKTYTEDWRAQLNQNVANKLKK